MKTSEFRWMTVFLILAVGLLSSPLPAQQPAPQPPVAGQSPVAAKPPPSQVTTPPGPPGGRGFRMDPALAKRYGLIVPPDNAAPPETPASERRFDLEFPGGTPQQFVDAVVRASGAAVNVVIPEEHAQVRIPAVQMTGVSVKVLFEAISQASLREVVGTSAFGSAPSGFPGYGQPNQIHRTAYGFRPVNDSVWVFYYERPPTTSSTRTVRFFQLGPYLEPLTVEDVTTAIQTGYRLLGESSAPELKFHKETKLLIAVGEPEKLSLIEAVLRELPKTKEASPPPKATSPRL